MMPKGPFTVGVDGMNLSLPEGTGIATYGRNLAIGNARLGHPVDLLFDVDVNARMDPALREILLFERLGGKQGRKPPGPVERVVNSAFWPGPRQGVEIPLGHTVVEELKQERLPPHRRVWSSNNVFRLAGGYFKLYGKFLTLRLPEPPTIMHWTYPLPIRVEGAYNVYTIHDVVPLRMPHTTLDDKRFHYRLIHRCLEWADQICTVSENSRRDILSVLPTVDPERVTNTYQALDATETSALDPSFSPERMFDLKPGGYFLYYGALEPKKNIGRLLEAFLSADIKMPLVLVGAKRWMEDGELKLLKTQLGPDGPDGGRKRIRQLDYLPRPMLMRLIQSARAVVFPSVYEGFGLPALEALAQGTPLLTSRTSALGEIVGDAALTIDPYDVYAISQGLMRLERDDELCARLAVAGPPRAELFSMAAYEARLSALYDQVLARPMRR